ncbi:MAG: PAS domain S-box protein, partial [Chloroflexota bacterium]
MKSRSKSQLKLSAPLRTLGRVVFLFLFASLFVFPAPLRLPGHHVVQAASSAPAPNEILKTIIVDDYFPYTFVNDKGQPDGFSVDLMQAVAQVMGISLEIRADTWERARNALENGEIDFLPMMAYSEERDKFFDFSPPHTIAYDAFFTREDTPVIRSIDDLRGKIIIVMEGDQAYDYLHSIDFIESEQLILVDSLPEALRYLASGMGDTALMPKLVGLVLIEDLNLTNLELSPVIVEAYTRPFSFAVREGNQALLERLNQGVSIVKATGQYDEIYQKWFGTLEPRGLPPEVALKYFGGLVLVSVLTWAALLLWSFFLKKQVALRTRSLTMEVLERKQAEEALRESEARYRTLFEDSPVSLWEEDFSQVREYFDELRAAGVDDFRAYFETHPEAVRRCAGLVKVLDVNKATLALVGVDSKEAILAPLSPVLAEESLMVFREELIVLAEGGQRFESEMLHRTPDGEIKFVTPHLSVAPGHENTLDKVLLSIPDVTERVQAEAALKESEARFAAIFHANPAAVALTRLDDNRLVDVNETWQEMTGYTRAEVIDHSPLELNLWVDAAQREYLVEALRQHGKTRSEILLRRKTGEVRDLLMSAEQIELAGERYLLTLAQDITERKRSEQIMQARLRLMQFANTHSLEELLQATLDEAEALTGSVIGFYHFLDADQKMLTLQAWSTNTLAKMCTAQGKGLHYSIDEAGVWVDCVRERRPVIHNDYASLPHRKGLPEGHAPVVRELVTPVFRGDKIVAILGVGNKPADYDQDDVKATGILADFAWEIAERKRAEEALAIKEREYRTVVENIPDFVVRYDTNLRRIFVNPAWEKGSGLSASEVIDVPVTDIQGVPHPVHAGYLEKLREALATGTPQEIVFTWVNASGAPLILEYKITPEYDLHGKVTSLLATGRDITERKQAEQALRESHDRMLLVLDSIPANIYVADIESYEILFANLHLRERFGDDLVGQKCWRVFCGAAGPCPHCTNDRLVDPQGSPTQGVTWEGQNALDRRWYTNYDRAIRWKDGKLVRVQIAVDITARKQAEEQLAHYTEKLEDMVEARTHELQEAQEQLVRQEKLAVLGQLAGGVGHELRNPLAVISNAVYFLRLVQPEADEKVREYLRLIENETHNAEKIINDLLDFSRV